MINQKVEAIETIIKKHLPQGNNLQKTVIDAMNYSVNAGGKRLRPMLMQEMYKLYGGNDDVIEYFMVAIELIHTYSLVHDDLPALDNDEYRRGNKTTHMVYGECMAILTGDALLNYAFEMIAKGCEKATDKISAIEAFNVISSKAGIFGMIGGQVADIEAEGKNNDLSMEHILFIHTNKTAALIQAALMCGAILANAPSNEIKTIEKIGYSIGVAFQVQDDILDITSTMEVLGKPIGSDDKNNKITYVSIMGLEQAKKDVESLSIEAIDMINSLSGKNEFLIRLVKMLINREK